MKALIVDDESNVRKAVRLLVDWEEHGFRQIDEAANGREAIELIQRERPDLVLMDMFMPVLDGLKLMEWLHSHHPDIRFIVISGHNDFELMRNTVWYNGIDYILKPVDEGLVNAAVRKAVASKQSVRQEQLARVDREVQLNEYLPVYAEKLLTSLIEDERAQAMAVRRLSSIGMLPEGLSELRLALLYIDLADNALTNRFDKDVDLLVYALLNICNEFLENDKKGVAFRHWGTKHVIVLLLWGGLDTSSLLLSRIHEGIRATLRCGMHFGLSAAPTDIAGLPRQYDEALTACRSRNLLQFNAYIHVHGALMEHPAEDAARQAPPLRFDEFENRWKVAILSGQESAIAEVAEEWMAGIRQNACITPLSLEQWNRDIERFHTRLAYDTIGSAAGELLASLKERRADAEMPSPDRYILSLSHWQQWWLDASLALAGELNTVRRSSHNLMADIAAYLDTHYQEEVSLFDIANRFYVSREYVSRKFKQTYGINMTDYVNQARVKNARVLLANPQLKMAAIAEMIGFANEKYFSTVFKKHEGISPNEYRKRITQA